MSEFWEAYRHPEWQKKRLEVMSKAGFQCVDCGTKEETLNVHHSYYEKGRKPWEYENISLRCLCEKCHKWRHAVVEFTRMTANLISKGDADRLSGYAETLFATYEPGYTIRVRSAEHAQGVADAIGLSGQGAAEKVLAASARLGFMSISDLGQLVFESSANAKS